MLPAQSIFALFNSIFKVNPIINPGMTQNMGNHTDPNSIPKIFACAEYIIPTVTRNAELTNGR